MSLHVAIIHEFSLLKYSTVRMNCELTFGSISHLGLLQIMLSMMFWTCILKSTYIYFSVGYILISRIAGLLKMEAFHYVKIIEIMPKCFPN